jgi:hypothetical protein
MRRVQRLSNEGCISLPMFLSSRLPSRTRWRKVRRVQVKVSCWATGRVGRRPPGFICTVLRIFANIRCISKVHSRAELAANAGTHEKLAWPLFHSRKPHKASVANMRESIRAAWKSLKQRYRLGLFSSFRARHAFVLCHPITSPIPSSRSPPAGPWCDVVHGL